MRLLQEAFRAEFERVLGRGDMSRSEVARALQISRQALYNYLAGAVPRKEHLSRILELWPDFHVEAGGRVYGKDALAPNPSSGPISVSRQLNLFEKLKELGQENLGIDVKRFGEDTHISVTIKISA